jgi:hypothetical protein
VSSWLRRNRWGLILLPVALVLALLASSSRVQLFWWNYGPHEVTHGRQGQPASFTEDWQDKAGHHTRSLRVSVRSVAPAHEVVVEDQPEPVQVTLPAGATLWRIELDVEADPNTVLWGCQVAIIDTQGRTFDTSTRLVEPSYKLKVSPCTPAGATGPQPILYEGMKQDPEQLDRPGKYTTSVYLPATTGAVPKTVRIWWAYPPVIEFAVQPSPAPR